MESKDKHIKKEMGKRLRFLRISEGRTQEDIASVLGCSPEHLSRVENGERGLSYEYLINLSSYFLVSVDWILTGESGSNAFSKQLTRVAKELITLANGHVIDDQEY